MFSWKHIERSKSILCPRLVCLVLIVISITFRRLDASGNFQGSSWGEIVPPPAPAPCPPCSPKVKYIAIEIPKIVRVPAPAPLPPPAVPVPAPPAQQIIPITIPFITHMPAPSKPSKPSVAAIPLPQVPTFSGWNV